MYRVSQRILTVFVLLMINFLNLYAGERVLSLSRAPDGTVLTEPHSVIFYENKYYVADSGNGRLISFGLDGKPLVALNPEGKLKRPVDFMFYKKSELWVIDSELRGLFRIDFQRKEIKVFFLNDNGKLLWPSVLQIYNDKMYVLDKVTGFVVSVRIEGENLVADKIIRPEDRKFKGFIDFRVNKDGLWGLSRLNNKVYHLKADGSWESISLKGKAILPVSLEVTDEYLFILDKYLKKVLVFKLTDISKVEEYGNKGWTVGSFYRPIKIRHLYSNLIGVVDEGNGRVEVIKF